MVCNSERKPAQPPRQACLPQSKDATADFVTLPFETTLAIGASELSGDATHTIVAHDPLSVSVQWRASTPTTSA